mmetsp:Transcript_37781/g.73982  ORF Transcript_37781/g.73982 Transcript_37781/m.73982 type:complete len:236 (-) Transcript_37781:447-1154(-)
MNGPTPDILLHDVCLEDDPLRNVDSEEQRGVVIKEVDLRISHVQEEIATSQHALIFNGVPSRECRPRLSNGGRHLCRYRSKLQHCCVPCSLVLVKYAHHPILWRPPYLFLVTFLVYLDERNEAREHPFTCTLTLNVQTFSRPFPNYHLPYRVVARRTPHGERRSLGEILEKGAAFVTITDRLVGFLDSSRALSGHVIEERENHVAWIEAAKRAQPFEPPLVTDHYTKMIVIAVVE